MTLLYNELNSVRLINVMIVNSWRQDAVGGWRWRAAAAQTLECVSLLPPPRLHFVCISLRCFALSLQSCSDLKGWTKGDCSVKHCQDWLFDVITQNAPQRKQELKCVFLFKFHDNKTVCCCNEFTFLLLKQTFVKWGVHRPASQASHKRSSQWRDCKKVKKKKAQHWFIKWASCVLINMFLKEQPNGSRWG